MSLCKIMIPLCGFCHTAKQDGYVINILNTNITEKRNFYNE
jgi:hypothetical protein